MAILGKDAFGKMNPLYNGMQNKEEKNKDEYDENSLEKDLERIDEEASQISKDPNVSGSLDYLDRMRKMNGFNKNPIGNQIRSDAQLFNRNNGSSL